MALDRQVKIELVERFTPILYLDEHEPDFPVDATEYVERAALWTSTPPHDRKDLWGLPSGASRRPLIPKGGISLNPAFDTEGTWDPDGDGVDEYYLGHSDGQGYPYLSATDEEVPGKELWLDLAAWQDGDGVGPGTENRRALGKSPGILRQPCYKADAWTLDELREQLGNDGVSRRFGIGPEETPEVLRGLVVVAFHFLFLTHREARKGTAHPKETDPYSHDYEGDWSTFAVVCRADDPGEVSARGCRPLFAAYGQRWRTVAPDHEGYVPEQMVLKRWESVLSVDEHPVVVAAPGTHNLYPHDEPRNPDGTITPQWVGFGSSTSEPANSFVSDAVEQPAASLFAAKVLAGFVLGGFLGAIVGVLAAEAESDVEGLYEPPKLDKPPVPSPDDPLSEDASDLEKDKTAKPQGLDNPPLVDASVSDIRDWATSPRDSLIDDFLPLQQDLARGGARFEGRWGVRCSDDPLLMRGGIRFPAYRLQIVDALLTQPVQML